MPDDEQLRSELQDLAGTYTTSAQLRERTEARIGQLRRRRFASRTAAVALAVGGVALVTPAIGSDDEPELTPGPPATTEACTGEEVIAADLDGDGQPDQVYEGWVDDQGEPTDPGMGDYHLTVCTAAGKAASITGVGNGETIRAIDIEPDGRAELLVGGTTASAVHLDLVVLVDDQLQPVREEGSDGTVLAERVTVTEGQAEAGPATAYGCEDMNGDGQRELVQVKAFFEDTEVTWAKEGYEVAGAVLGDSYSDAGAGPPPDDHLAFAKSLTAPCEDASTAADPPAPALGEFFDVPPGQWPDAGVAVVQGDETIFFFDDEGTDFGFLRDAALASQLGTGNVGPLEITYDGGTFAAARAAAAEDPPGCEGATGAGGVRVALCGGEPQLRTQIVRVDPDGDTTVLTEAAPGSAGVGHWRWALPSPDGQWVLAQWSGECEVPVAYVIPTAGDTPQPLGADRTPGGGSTESIATGWTADGRIITTFPSPGCGSGLDRPGSYLVDPDSGEETLVWPDRGGIRSAFRWRRVSPTGNAPELAITRALSELGIDGCCGEPSHGGSNAVVGAAYNGTDIPIYGSPLDPSNAPPYVAFNDLVIDSQPSDLDGLPVTVGTADLGPFLAFTCGDYAWSLGGAGAGDRAEPAELRALATSLIEHLYCTVGDPPLATGHG